MCAGSRLSIVFTYLLKVPLFSKKLQPLARLNVWFACASTQLLEPKRHCSKQLQPGGPATKEQCRDSMEPQANSVHKRLQVRWMLSTVCRKTKTMHPPPTQLSTTNQSIHTERMEKPQFTKCASHILRGIQTHLPKTNLFQQKYSPSQEPLRPISTT